MNHLKITGPTSEVFKYLKQILNKWLDLPEREQSRKRRDVPIEIKSVLNLKKHKKFTINYEFLPNSTCQPKNDDNNSYWIGVYMTKEISQEHIVEYFTKFEWEGILDTVKRMDKQLSIFTNDDIISDELKFYLNCPIIRSFGSLKIPARGFKWEHMDCFDLGNFLQINIKFKQFKCPYCNKNWNILKVNPLLLTVLRKMNEMSRKYAREISTMNVIKDESSPKKQNISWPLLFKFEDISESVTLEDVYKLFVSEMKDNSDKLFQVNYILEYFCNKHNKK